MIARHLIWHRCPAHPWIPLSIFIFCCDAGIFTDSSPTSLLCSVYWRWKVFIIIMMMICFSAGPRNDGHLHSTARYRRDKQRCQGRFSEGELAILLCFHDIYRLFFMTPCSIDMGYLWYKLRIWCSHIIVLVGDLPRSSLVSYFRAFVIMSQLTELLHYGPLVLIYKLCTCCKHLISSIIPYLWSSWSAFACFAKVESQSIFFEQMSASSSSTTYFVITDDSVTRFLQIKRRIPATDGSTNITPMSFSRRFVYRFDFVGN